MNTGHAADLVPEILEDNTNMFPDWATFESWFLLEFTRPNEVECTVLMLESTSYHQQSCTLDTYMDS